MVTRQKENTVSAFTENFTRSIFCAFILFFTVISSVVQAANITVKTSRNPVALDDSFHLIYEADSTVDDDPDFSPIYKDFDVLSSSQSTNMRSINGNWSLKKTWDLSIIAKDVGNFTIPAINFGSDVSPAIRLTISNSTSPNSVSPGKQVTIPAKIFLENVIDKRSGWIQSQFIYTIRLLRTVTIANASLTEPKTSDPDAIIHMVSEDNYQTTRNGIRYEVFERRYAIFPQKSGVLKINPITFEGRINATQPRSLFDQFRMSGQLKRLRSQPIAVTINAAPENINLQNWIPATEVQLVEEWSDDIQNLKAGEPITRTIMIAAQGLTGIQLPDLKFSDVDGLKQYPDKPVIDDKQSASGITGYKQIKVALIPAHTGSYTLPEIKLRWWNTKTNKQQTTVIPATHLNVTGSAIDNTPIIQPQSEITAPLDIQSSFDDTTVPQTIVINNEPYWKWLTLFFSITWLLTLLLFFKKTDSRNKQEKSKLAPPSIKQAISEVEKYSKKNNAKKTKAALIQWAKIFYGDKTLTNLTQVSAHCSPQLAEEIRHLNESLYSPEKLSWGGKNLMIAFKNEQSLSNKQSEKTSALKPLYNQ